MVSRRPIRFKLCAAAVVFLAAPLLADDADFCIGGTVVNALTGEPIRRAAVTTPQAANLTDAAGAFSFCGLQPGSYFANAEKPGFASAGSTIAVGPSRQDVQLRLQPLAIVKGRVLDSNGDPLESAVIQLLSLRIQDGRRKVRLQTIVTTDDQGEYRLAGIAPGRYLVRSAGWQDPGGPASDEAGSTKTFAPVYYGGSADLTGALPLTVEAGREIIADFTVALQTAYRIRGAVTGYSTLLPVTIELRQPEDGLSVTRTVDFNGATGALEIGAVAPGSYILRATQGDGDQRLTGEQAVQIASSDVKGVHLSMAGVVALSGTVRVEQASGAPPLPPGCSVALSSAAALMTEPATLESETGEDGAFQISGVLPGRYRLRMDCAGGYLTSVHLGDIDLLARDELTIPAGAAPPPLDAVLSTDGGTVEVTAMQNDAPVAAALLLLPDSASNLHARFSIVKGRSTLTEVAPGDYHAYVLNGSPDEFEYANTNVRQTLAGRAVSVHVDPRDRQTIVLQIPAGESP